MTGPSSKRKVRGPLIATVGAATLVAAQGYHAGHRQLPHFEDHDTSVPASDAQSDPLQIVALGDSTLTGPGLDRPADVWLHQALDMIDAGGHAVRSFAKGGAKVRDVVTDQLTSALTASPDLAIVSVGSNDSLRGVTIGAMRRDLAPVVESLAAISVVVLLGIGDLGTIPRLPQPLAGLARARGRMVDRMQLDVASNHERVLKVPLYELAGPVFRANDNLFASDLFHPNMAGQRVWANAAAPTLRRAISHTIRSKRSNG